MTRSNPTLHEVAKAAGVSIATVSRVIHGGAGVSAALQRRVQDSIDTLGYRPSHFGRALVQRRHGAIGIVFPGLYGPYYSELIHGVESVAIESRIAVMILGTHLLDGAADHVLSLADRTDGLAVLGGSVPDTVIEKLASRGKPLVLMAQHQYLELPTVRVDNRDSTRELTTHLLTTHDLHRLVFVGTTANSPDIDDRWHGFADAHAMLDRPAPAPPVAVGLEIDHGRHAGLEILNRPDRPGGIVCGNDEVALGVLSATRSLGVRIPEDVAVTGWDDIPLASHAHPPLTTVRQPARDIGSRTARVLIGHINGDAEGAERIELATTPIYRRSCGCPYHDVPNGDASDLTRLVGGEVPN